MANTNGMPKLTITDEAIEFLDRFASMTDLEYPMFHIAFCSEDGKSENSQLMIGISPKSVLDALPQHVRDEVVVGEIRGKLVVYDGPYFGLPASRHIKIEIAENKITIRFEYISSDGPQ